MWKDVLHAKAERGKRGPFPLPPALTHNNIRRLELPAVFTAAFTFDTPTHHRAPAARPYRDPTRTQHPLCRAKHEQTRVARPHVCQFTLSSTASPSNNRNTTLAAPDTAKPFRPDASMQAPPP
jgi:hypothetical protein